MNYKAFEYSLTTWQDGFKESEGSFKNIVSNLSFFKIRNLLYFVLLNIPFNNRGQIITTILINTRQKSFIIIQ